jgi:hypothetical protein
MKIKPISFSFHWRVKHSLGNTTKEIHTHILLSGEANLAQLKPNERDLVVHRYVHGTQQNQGSNSNETIVGSCGSTEN